MEKLIDQKIFCELEAYKYEAAQQILGACALENAWLVVWRVKESANTYEYVRQERCFIWRSLTSDCWLRADVDRKTVCLGNVLFPPKLPNDSDLYHHHKIHGYCGPVEG